MAKRIKKVNPKDTMKKEVMEIVVKALIENGLTVESGEDYGMTKGTAVVKGQQFDLQLKPITTKTGVDRYEKIEIEG